MTPVVPAWINRYDRRVNPKLGVFHGAGAGKSEYFERP